MCRGNEKGFCRWSKSVESGQYQPFTGTWDSSYGQIERLCWIPRVLIWRTESWKAASPGFITLEPESNNKSFIAVRLGTGLYP